MSNLNSILMEKFKIPSVLKARSITCFLYVYMLLYIDDENVTLAFFTMTLTPNKRPIFLLYLNLSHENLKLLTTFCFFLAINENEQKERTHNSSPYTPLLPFALPALPKSDHPN